VAIVLEKEEKSWNNPTNEKKKPSLMIIFSGLFCVYVNLHRNCPKCKTRRKATKRLSLAKLPPILLIHLKRFSFKGPFSDKLETFVQYPLYGLDLSSYVPPPLSPAALSNELKPVYEDVATRSSPESNVYDLYAVCNHFGSLSSGHCSFLSSTLLP
jgi:ubiquitin carboxyl-terminal hydrolase 8